MYDSMFKSGHALSLTDLLKVASLPHLTVLVVSSSSLIILYRKHNIHFFGYEEKFSIRKLMLVEILLVTGSVIP